MCYAGPMAATRFLRLSDGRTARWGLGRVIGLVMACLALILLVNAPIGASLMAVDAPFDRALCSAHAGAGHPPDKAPPVDHQACQSCTLCALDGGALPAPIMAAAASSWVAYAPGRPIVLAAAPQPPRLRPHARGPPASS